MFLPEVMQAISKCCDIKHLRATTFHPEINGLIEKINGSLKNMSKTYVHDLSIDWDDKLPYFLFAYKEVPQESTGFSSFELMYGEHPRGPFSLVKEEWEGKISEKKTSRL